MDSSFFWIGLGGAAGAIARVGFMQILPPFFLNLPLKIFCVNVLGCFVLGILTGLMTLYGNSSLNIRHFLIQGFLGGFTTFSAFALEFGLLYEKGAFWTALSYAVLSVVVSIVCLFLGIKIVKIACHYLG